MRPNFALDFSLEDFRLLHRSPSNKWTVVGEIALDKPTLKEDVAFIRAKAIQLEGRKFTTKLIMPRQEILYETVRISQSDPRAATEQIEDELRRITPYKVSDLAYDCQFFGGRARLAVIVRKILEEAEAFAVEHGLNPLYFTATPESQQFSGEPDFGATSHSTKLIKKGEQIQRDEYTIVVNAGRALGGSIPKRPTPSVSKKVEDRLQAAVSMDMASGREAGEVEEPKRSWNPLRRVLPRKAKSRAPEPADYSVAVDDYDPYIGPQKRPTAEEISRLAADAARNQRREGARRLPLFIMLAGLLAFLAGIAIWSDLVDQEKIARWLSTGEEEGQTRLAAAPEQPIAPKEHEPLEIPFLPLEILDEYALDEDGNVISNYYKDTEILIWVKPPIEHDGETELGDIYITETDDRLQSDDPVGLEHPSFRAVRAVHNPLLPEPGEDGGSASPESPPARHAVPAVRPVQRPDGFELRIAHKREILRQELLARREELGRVRPLERPLSEQDRLTPSNPEPTRLAVLESAPPPPRPRNIKSIVEQTRATTAVSTAMLDSGHNTPTKKVVAENSTMSKVINLDKINLIGVYGTSIARKALVRLATGEFVSVRMGSSLDGGRVIAIDTNTLRYVKDGNNNLLKVPGR